MGSSKLPLLLVLLSCVERCLSASCVVDSFTVKEDFDPKRVSELKHTDSMHVEKSKVKSFLSVWVSIVFIAVCRKVVRAAEERSRGPVPAGQHLSWVHHWRWRLNDRLLQRTCHSFWVSRRGQWVFVLTLPYLSHYLQIQLHKWTAKPRQRVSLVTKTFLTLYDKYSVSRVSS